MASTLAITFGFVIIGVVLAAVLGAVERREKFPFVAGIVLIAGGPILAGSLSLPAAVGGVVAFVGFLAVAGSTVPLLRQSPRTS